MTSDVSLDGKSGSRTLIGQESAIRLNDENIAVVALREYAGIGAKMFQQLLVAFGSPSAVFRTEPGAIAALPRMTGKREENIRSAIDQADAISRRLTSYQDRDIDLVTIIDPDYPETLMGLGDPPPLLYYRGDLKILRENTVAIVGSHEASAEGVAEAVRLGKEISATGAVVISGLARGIDSGAHVGAIQGDGRTAAVLGCGFDEIYPPENLQLAENILGGGVLISEYPPETQVSSGRLLARNRVIVGLAGAVIVVEATSDQGGTATAIRESVKQGKSLFTCFDPNLEGDQTNKMGAVFLSEPDDWKMVLRYMV